MITEKKAITLAEVKEIVDTLEESQEIKNYLKKFTKLSKDKTLKLMEELKDLKSHKLKEENIIKIADFLPKSSEELSKVLIEISLSEEEINAILDITKEY